MEGYNHVFVIEVNKWPLVGVYQGYHSPPEISSQKKTGGVGGEPIFPTFLNVIITKMCSSTKESHKYFEKVFKKLRKFILKNESFIFPYL